MDDEVDVWLAALPLLHMGHQKIVQTKRSVLICFVLVLAMAQGHAVAQEPIFFPPIDQNIRGTLPDDNGFAGGTGTAEDPWLVATAEQLDLLRQYLGSSHSDKHFRQIAPIDLGQEPWNQGPGWEPIGTAANAFYGHYDGNGQAISGLTINRPSTNNVGMWAFIGSGGEVHDLAIYDASVHGGSYTVGVLAALNRGSIWGVHATGSVSGGYRVGGLVGENNPGSVEDSQAHVDVMANDGRIGGLVGFNVSGSVSGSFATGDVTAGWYVGGLVGRNLNGTIQRSYATGNVIGSNSVGGLLGDTEGGAVSDSYATGSVSAGGAVGGLIGYLWQTNVSNTYSVGSVSGTSWGVGGLIGYRFGGQVNHSYWNTESSGQSGSDGGTGKSTHEMVLAETYVLWDFQEAWDIMEEVSYPFLGWQEEPGSHNHPFTYSLTLLASPATGGAPQADPDQSSYSVGASIWLEAGTGEGYEFIRWTDEEGEEVSLEEAFHFVMPAQDVELTAHFLEMTPGYTLSFIIEDIHGNMLPDAVVTLNGVEHEAGEHVFEGLEAGFHEYSVAAEGYFDKQGEAEITDHDKELSVVMDPDDTSSGKGTVELLRAYPNPVRGILNLEIYHRGYCSLQVYLVQLSSGLVKRNISLSGHGHQQLSICTQELPAGTYLLKLRYQGGTFHKPVIVM